MKCPYCGKNVSENDKYCSFCGARNENLNASIPEPNPSVNSNGMPTPERNTGAAPKKKMKAWQIILIVFLVCSILVCSLAALSWIAFEKTIDTMTGSKNWKDWDSAAWSEWADEFSEGFEEEYGDEFYSGFEGSDKFIPGEVDVDTNTYKSEFSGLSFTLPAGFETATADEIYDLYEYNEDGVDRGVVDNYLSVYDFYSENKMTNVSIEIDYHNIAYYDDYENIADYNQYLKDELLACETDYDNCRVNIAKDSKKVLCGQEYYQIAAQVIYDDYYIYEYDFTREVNGYYMNITIIAHDLDSVGTVIDSLSGEGK